ncbi:MAG: hypothetical protein KDH95_04070 [Calditrichaeota bacterium]|nr:hypothetical protein [Calditrichota bacterium]MCB0267326.1 hypothetical protein [Calditrichota bacterium]
MNTPKVFLATVLMAISLNSCLNNKTTTNIEGLWISTEETSALFEPWAQKVALEVRRDSINTLTARGFFFEER